MHTVKCFECGADVEDEFADACPRCGGILTIEMDLDAASGMRPADLRKKPIGVWRYAPFLPVDERNAISLLEGGTPLYHCKALGKKAGVKSLHVKYEGANPTGSFKDRGMTVGVSRALELGCKTVGCASTGNTSASLAAYAAKGDLKCVVLLPNGKVAAGKLAQAMFYGAKVVMVDGNFDDALNVVKTLSREGELYLLNSINPYRPEGQKTVAFEIVDQLDFDVPDRVILPVGNAANIWAVYKAFKEWKALGWVDKVPKLTGIQAAGSAPIVRAFQAGKRDFVPEEHPETVATAIRIGNPASGKKALQAIYDTNGYAESVTDEEIVAAQKLLGRTEGVGVEPASAASVAGLLKLVDTGVISKDERVVCICTGNVLKDPDTVMRSCEEILKAKPTAEDVKRVIAK
ncbi:threonine synthase [Methanomassiliicoccus luminyensis]|uniref:threonine synthase n=1 Tax=Methanomassiliicoccus luminyensis TaxID=1080712 RepID=UPI0006748BB7|nr:threonine synthase [Methanomassiliicoccus luminyensis]